MMQARRWKIGDIVPAAPVTPLQGIAHGAPCWYVFLTTPRGEASAQAWLDKRGVESWFPTETRWRNIPRGKIKRAPYDAVCVPRYIFARFEGAPAWHVLRTCRWVSGVVGYDGDPLPVSDETLAEMTAVPARLEIIRKQEEERRTIRPGDKVRIKDGAMEGWVVEVASVHAGIAKFMVPLLGDRETEISVARLRK